MKMIIVKPLGQAFDPGVPPLVSCGVFRDPGSQCELDQARDRLMWKYQELQQYWNSTRDSAGVCSYQYQIAQNLKQAVRVHLEGCTPCVSPDSFAWVALDQLIAQHQNSFNAANQTNCGTYVSTGASCDPLGEWSLFGECWSKKAVLYVGGAIILLVIVLPLLQSLTGVRRR